MVWCIVKWRLSSNLHPHHVSDLVSISKFANCGSGESVSLAWGRSCQPWQPHWRWRSCNFKTNTEPDHIRRSDRSWADSKTTVELRSTLPMPGMFSSRNENTADCQSWVDSRPVTTMQRHTNGNVQQRLQRSQPNYNLVVLADKYQPNRTTKSESKITGWPTAKTLAFPDARPRPAICQASL